MNLCQIRRTFALLTIAAITSACATIQPARMAMPDGLAARSDLVELSGISSGRQGRADVIGETLQFERSATRLALFDDFSIANSAALRYSISGASGKPSAANCSVSRRTMAIGIVEWAAKPLVLSCDFTPFGARLELQEHRPALATTKIDRRGRLVVGGRTLTVRSVHKAEGGLLELAQPIGYVIEEGGRALAAVETTDSRKPRLYLPNNDPALRQASLHALLALALMWDATDG